MSINTLTYLLTYGILTASAGAAAGGILYIASYLPSAISDADVSSKAKFGMSLLPCSAMTIGCKIIAHFEGSGMLS